jgi:DNA primase
MPRIAQETVEQVAAASNIVEVIGSYFPLKRAGSQFRALCPFHQEKTPSFYVNPAKQSFYCFGCGAGGAVFQFLMQYENVDFPESVRRLASRAGIPIVDEELTAPEEERLSQRKRLLRLHFEAAEWFHRNLLRTKAADHARAYMKSRALDIGIAKNWRIGYAPNTWNAFTGWATEAGFKREEIEASGLVKCRDENNPKSGTYDRFRDRLIFPICNDVGEVIAFSGRILDPKAAGGKYINSPETPLFSKGSILFGLHKSKRAIASARQAIVLEGQLDLIMTFEAGIQNVVAPQGTALTEKHARLLRRFSDEIILFFDSDRAGERAAERALEVLFGAGLQVRIGRLPAGEDPDSMIRKSGAGAFKQQVETAEDFFDFQMRHNSGVAGLGTTAGRVAFARKMAQFVIVIPDAVLRDTVISRLTARLSISRDAFGQMIQAQVRAPRPTTDEPRAEAVKAPRHDIAVICKAALTESELLGKIRVQPWESVLRYVDGAELLAKILGSDLQIEEPASLGVFFASLPQGEAAQLSQILANRELNSEMGELFWREFAISELERRRLELEEVQRLRSDDRSACDQAAQELKEVLDLETRITDISRFPSGNPK